MNQWTKVIRFGLSIVRDIVTEVVAIYFLLPYSLNTFLLWLATGYTTKKKKEKKEEENKLDICKAFQLFHIMNHGIIYGSNTT